MNAKTSFQTSVKNKAGESKKADKKMCLNLEKSRNEKQKKQRKIKEKVNFTLKSGGRGPL